MIHNSSATAVDPVIRELPILILSPHARCNCRCVMCDIWKRTSNDQLTLSELNELLLEFQRLHVKWIVLSGGEPLMHPQLFQMCELMRLKDIRVTLLSTGLLLARYAQQIKDYTNDVIVSLDGPPPVHDLIRRVPGAFASLERGIVQLQKIDPHFHVSARCTVQQRNHDHLVETAMHAEALGLRSISFLAADLTSEAFNRPNGWPVSKQDQVALNRDQILTLENECRELNSRWSGTGFVLESRHKLQRIVKHFEAHIGLCEAESPRCNAPWVSAVIEADGAVRPCFFQPSIGSLKHAGLMQILNGPQGIAFRQSLDIRSNSICRRCVCSLDYKAGVGAAN